MSKTNGTAEDSPKPPPAITSLSVSGFKSIVEGQTLGIRPLTLLAGANSSGKSSMMQPLLLLKQTLESPYDPGPLLLNGPNARFTSATQFLSIVPDRATPRPFSFSVGMSSGSWFEVEYGWDRKRGILKIVSNSFKIDDHVIRITGLPRKEHIAGLFGIRSPALAAGFLESWAEGAVLLQKAGCILRVELPDRSISYDGGSSEIKGVVTVQCLDYPSGFGAGSPRR